MDRITHPTNRNNVILVVLLICFSVMNLRIPDNMAKGANSIPGHVVITGITIFLFTKTHPIVGILFAIAAYELINRSSDMSMYTVAQYIPSEAKKLKKMAGFNSLDEEDLNPDTQYEHSSLEEDMISMATPLPEHETVASGANYKPVLSDCAGASDLN